MEIPKINNNIIFNKTNINLFDKESYIEELKRIIINKNNNNNSLTFNPYIEDILHLDILSKKNVLIKIEEYQIYGSIRDVLNSNKVRSYIYIYKIY